MKGETFQERQSQTCWMLLIGKTGTMSTEQNMDVTVTIPQVASLLHFSPYDMTSCGLCYPASLRVPFSPAPQTRLHNYPSTDLPFPAEGRPTAFFRRNRSMGTDWPAPLCPAPAFCVSLPHSGSPWASPLSVLSGVSHSVSLSPSFCFFLSFYSLLPMTMLKPLHLHTLLLDFQGTIQTVLSLTDNVLKDVNI